MRLGAGILFVLGWAGCSHPGSPRTVSEPVETRDPAAWGSDHVGEPLPEYMTGGQCLFCHRSDVGPGWQTNPHQTTLALAEGDGAPLKALLGEAALEAVAGDVQLVLGGRKAARYLKRAGHGRLALLTATWMPGGDGGEGRIDPLDPHWDATTFGKRCAGCHTTGVDSESRTFSSLSLDCFVCHGDAGPEHTQDSREMIFSKKRNDPARVVISVCAQCHVRTGRSRNSGLSYPDNFVPGDNLFRDFVVDLSDKALSALSVADRHVLENVRDVVLDGRDDVTCLSCHEVHARSSRKHRRLPRDASCASCHGPGRPGRLEKALETHNATCEY